MKGGSDQHSGGANEHPRKGGRSKAERARTDYTEFGYRDCDAGDPLDAYFDGEADRRSAEFRAAFVKSRKFRADVAAIEEIVFDLTRPVKEPDLSSRILAAVDDHRPFVTGQARRFVTVGRLVAAASVLLLLTGAVLVERARPGTIEFTPKPTPVSGVVDAGGRSAPLYAAISKPGAPGETSSIDTTGDTRPGVGERGSVGHVIGRAIAGLGSPVKFEVYTNAPVAVRNVDLTNDHGAWMGSENIGRYWGMVEANWTPGLSVQSASWRSGRLRSRDFAPLSSDADQWPIRRP